MLESILLGLLLAMATITIHAIGTAWWISHLKRIPQTKQRTDAQRFVMELRVLCSTAAVLLSLHILEVVVWGVAYLMLDGGELVTSFEEAIYFSMVTFASLGYGDVVIDGPWRLLAAIQAMTGLLAFGWSSALMFAIVQKIWEASDPKDSIGRENDGVERDG